MWIHRSVMRQFDCSLLDMHDIPASWRNGIRADILAVRLFVRSPLPALRRKQDRTDLGGRSRGHLKRASKRSRGSSPFNLGQRTSTFWEPLISCRHYAACKLDLWSHRSKLLTVPLRSVLEIEYVFHWTDRRRWEASQSPDGRC